MSTPFFIRPMQMGDFDTVADLSAELGYPVNSQQLFDNFGRAQSLHENAFFVAEATDARTVVGWLHAYGVAPFIAEPYAEIGGLVVAAAARKLGIGRALMQAAEQWASDNDYRHVRLRSGNHRPEAHLFYERIGYHPTRSSTMFKKPVPA